MQELRLVAVSEDGTYAVLTVPGRSGRFSLPIDDSQVKPGLGARSPTWSPSGSPASARTRETPGGTHANGPMAAGWCH